MGRFLKRVLGITALEDKVQALEERVSELEKENITRNEGITAKQLLNEYLYGENGDE